MNMNKKIEYIRKEPNIGRFNLSGRKIFWGVTVAPSKFTDVSEEHTVCLHLRDRIASQAGNQQEAGGRQC
jgi:hypothetical protein